MCLFTQGSWNTSQIIIIIIIILLKISKTIYAQHVGRTWSSRPLALWKVPSRWYIQFNEAKDCENGKAKACLKSYRNILNPTVRYIRPLCGLSVQGRMKGEESKAALTDDMGHLLKKKRRLAGDFCKMLIRRNDPPPQSWLYVAEVPTWRPSMALAF